MNSINLLIFIVLISGASAGGDDICSSAISSTANAFKDFYKDAAKEDSKGARKLLAVYDDSKQKRIEAKEFVTLVHAEVKSCTSQVQKVLEKFLSSIALYFNVTFDDVKSSLSGKKQVQNLQCIEENLSEVYFFLLELVKNLDEKAEDYIDLYTKKAKTTDKPNES